MRTFEVVILKDVNRFDAVCNTLSLYLRPPYRLERKPPWTATFFLRMYLSSFILFFWGGLGTFISFLDSWIIFKIFWKSAFVYFQWKLRIICFLLWWFVLMIGLVAFTEQHFCWARGRNSLVTSNWMSQKQWLWSGFEARKSDDIIMQKDNFYSVDSIISFVGQNVSNY